MRLVYVTSMLPFGPMEAFVIPEILELRRRGHELLVVPMRPRGPVVHDDARAFLEDTRRQPLLSPRIVASALWALLSRPRRVLAAARRLAATRGARNLALNLAVFPKALWLASLARRWGADQIHVHWASAPATMAYLASEVSGLPWSVTAHRYDIHQGNLLVEKARSARFVRAISERGAAELAALLGPAADKVGVIHMGVPLPGAPVSAAPRTGQPLRVVVAANLREVKGHRYLVDAAALLAARGVDVQIDLAGDGPLRRELEAQVLAAGLAGRVRLLGVVAHGQLLAGLREGRWDAAVLPSIAVSDTEQEGIPVSLIEAMACHVPVVGTRTGGIPELLHGDAGLLVPDRDPEALATALARLARDPALRLQLGRRGRERVEREFSVESTATALERRFLALP